MWKKQLRFTSYLNYMLTVDSPQLGLLQAAMTTPVVRGSEMFHDNFSWLHCELTTIAFVTYDRLSGQCTLILIAKQHEISNNLSKYEALHITA